MTVKEDQIEDLEGINVLIFDIVGTLLDSTGTVINSMTSILSKYGINEEKAQSLAKDWMSKQTVFQEEIIKGKQPWVVEDDIRRYQLEILLKRENIFLTTEDFEKLGSIGRRFVPWPKASEQLNELCSLITTIGLTNSGFVQIIEACTQGQLYWHALFSTQFVQTYKPHPAAYKLAIETLEIKPFEALFISTHPWDLRAASSHGMHTAYLPRDHATEPDPEDKFDLNLESLEELISLIREKK